jgi:hypothetical protein
MSAYDGQDVALAQNQVLLTLDFDFSTTILGKDNAISVFHLERHTLAIVEQLTSTQAFGPCR